MNRLRVKRHQHTEVDDAIALLTQSKPPTKTLPKTAEPTPEKVTAPTRALRPPTPPKEPEPTRTVQRAPAPEPETSLRLRRERRLVPLVPAITPADYF
jgi:hypothetical protein